MESGKVDDGLENITPVAASACSAGVLTVVLLFYFWPVAEAAKAAAGKDALAKLAELPPPTEQPASASTPPPPQQARSAPSLGRVWCFTAVNLAYGFCIALQGMVAAPQDVKRLWPGHSSLALGAVMSICGVAQLLGPEAGYWSDTWRHSLGRRRPLIVISTSAVVSLSFGLWLCSLLQLRLVYFFVFLLQQLAWNVLASTHVGLVPDLVPETLQGFAGGASASNVLVGALAAFLSVIAFSGQDHHLHYGLMNSFLVACVTLVCMVAQEESSVNRKPPEDHEGLSLSSRILLHYTLDVRKHQSFAFLLLTKTLYCAATVVKGFILYFAQDTFQLPAGSTQELTARVAIMAECAAALAALASMLLLDGGGSDSGGGGRDEGAVGVQGARGSSESSAPSSTAYRSLIALGLGSAWMGALWFGPWHVGLRIQEKFPQGGKSAEDAYASFMVIGSAIWGAGQGLYLAGDQTLSFVLVPDRAEAAAYLAFNSVCAFLGGSIGGLACGCLLAHVGRDAPSGQAYAFPGYAAIFFFAVACCLTISSVAGLMYSTMGRSTRLQAREF